MPTPLQEAGIDIRALPRAYGPAAGTATLGRTPAAFRVDEVLGFEPSGAGEHLFLQVRKSGRTTDAAARALAGWLGVRERNVGYAGLKDKHAITTQWFSVPTPEQPEPGPLPDDPAVEVLRVTRNARKLRRGALAGNRFAITLDAVQGAPEAIGARLLRVALWGAPNYFGAQRFGSGGGNVAEARALLAGERRVRSRHRRSLYLSAARSYLFNRVLAARIDDGSWSRGLPGELVMLSGSNSVFRAGDEAPDELAHRLSVLDVHPTGPMPGRGGMQPEGRALAAETAALANESALVEGLAEFGVTGMRRALRMRVSELRWHWPADQTLEVGFTLGAGCYATMVLREALEVDERPARLAADSAAA